MGKYIGFGALGTLVLVCIVSYFTAWSAGNRAEQQINAEWENNENILAQYGQKIREAAQLTEMQRDDVAAILTGGLDARYGADGSQAAFQWIQEQNPNVTSEVYVQIQRIIEAGRNEFQNAQTRLVDVKRGYRTQLGSPWRGTWLGVVGYPQINVGFPIGSDDDYRVITTARASNAFETGVEEPISLRD